MAEEPKRASPSLLKDCAVVLNENKERSKPPKRIKQEFFSLFIA